MTRLEKFFWGFIANTQLQAVIVVVGYGLMVAYAVWHYG